MIWSTLSDINFATKINRISTVARSLRSSSAIAMRLSAIVMAFNLVWHANKATMLLLLLGELQSKLYS